MAVARVRACRAVDREQAAALFVAAFPLRAGEIETWSGSARSWRCVAVVGAPGRVVAYGAVWPFRADGYRMDLVVSPSWRRHGVGSLVLASEVEQARTLGAVTLQARAEDGWTDALRFLRAHGFAETMRMHRQVLDVAAATLGRVAGLESRLAGEGVRITTLAGELASEPLCWTKFRDVHRAAGDGWVDPDPRPTPDPPMSSEEFRRTHQRATAYHGVSLVECLLAVHGDRYVGFTGVMGTGVHPDYRGRGIATALKARWITQARDRGVPTDTTASGNPAMLHINQALGYRLTSTEIRLVKPLRSITDQ